MFERFTEGARQVVVFAQEEARALKHNYIGTEHILLGLLREEDRLAARLLVSLGISLHDVRLQVARIVGNGDEVNSGQLPLTPRSRTVLEGALGEALALGHNYIGTEHILLGLVRENQGVAARILLDFDADDEKIRSLILRRISGPGRRGQIPSEGDWLWPAGPVWKIDDATRALTVGYLLDSITSAKEAAIETKDLNRAATIRDLERRLTKLLTSIPPVMGRDQSPPPPPTTE